MSSFYIIINSIRQQQLKTSMSLSNTLSDITLYKKRLVETIQIMHNAEQTVLTAMVNVGFSGIYSEIAEAHEEIISGNADNPAILLC